VDGGIDHYSSGAPDNWSGLSGLFARAPDVSTFWLTLAA
jgi:hypothetical protein